MTTLRFDGDEAGLVKSYENIIKKQKEQIRGLKETAKEGKASGDVNKRALKEMEQAQRAAMTSSDKYAESVRKINRYERDGLITKEQARRKIEELATAQRKAAGPSALMALGQMAAAHLTVSRAIQVVTSALRAEDAQRDEIARKQREAKGGIGMLAQVATSREDMAFLYSQVQQTLAEGGAEDKGQAARLVFQLRSAGASDQRQLFSQLKSTDLVTDPAIMARAAKTLQTSMGTKETGSMRDLISKAFGASQFSPASAEALLEASARSGGSAAALGVGDEEVLAATAITATASGSAELGGTQVAALLKSLRKKGATGGSIAEMVEDVQAKGMSGEQLFEYFGRAEAVNAFDALTKNMDKFREATGAVTEAQRRDEVGARLAYGGVVAELGAGQQGQQVEGFAEVMRTGKGVERQRAETVQRGVDVGLEMMGQDPISRWFGNRAIDLLQMLPGGDRMLGGGDGELKEIADNTRRQPVTLDANVE